MRHQWIFKLGFPLVIVTLAGVGYGQEDDYQFPSRIRLSEIGDDDRTSRLAEGFEGLDAEPGINRMIEPIDGAGGFDNIAPRMRPDRGPGGDWDISPSRRTSYKNGTNYAAGAGIRIQGNNWFTRIPYITFGTNTGPIHARFDANMIRIYTASGGVWFGQYENKNSKLVRTGAAGSYVWVINDTRGKAYTFQQAAPANSRLTKITYPGGEEITLSYASTSITVLQKPSSTAGTEVRRYIYTLNAAGTRLDYVTAEEKIGGIWILFRKLDFVYHEDIAGAVEGSTGDLIGINEETLLSQSSPTWLVRKTVYKYYTGTYNSSTNPGSNYQVKAVLEPQSVRDWEAANSGLPTTDIYKKTAAQLSVYVDRQYEYNDSLSQKRVRKIDFKASCGCGSGEGVYQYAWLSQAAPADLNTWNYRVTITLPSVIGSLKIIDFNKNGQLLNYVDQEGLSNPGTRRWIRTWQHDINGALTDSYSVDACTGYTDATGAVSTTNAAGMRYQFTYDPSNYALSQATLLQPGTANFFLQAKKVFSLLTSGDRRRFLKTSETSYPTETTNPATGVVTTWEYTFHAADALAVKSRRTVLPVVTTLNNGSNTAIRPLSYFETDGRLTWSRDGDNFVHYTAYDTQRRTITQRITDVNTTTLVPPAADAGLPGGDAGFSTPAGGGLHLSTTYTYDFLGRMRTEVRPAFNAWTGSSVVSVNPTRVFFYTKLSGGELVMISYDHLDGTYFHHAIGLTVYDYEGHAITQARGSLLAAKRNTNVEDDLLVTQPTLEAAFQGTLVSRRDYTFQGGKLTKEEVWSEATSSSAPRYTTEHTYDGAGRRLTTKTSNGATVPSITRLITRWGYDVLGRVKTKKIGTIDGGGSDNMTLVEERFYDNEELASTNVGDGTLTQLNRYTEQGGAPRTTTYTYDYRNRLTQTNEPLGVVEVRSGYNNWNQIGAVTRLVGAIVYSQTQHVYDEWGREFRTKETRVPYADVNSDLVNDFAKTESWRDARGNVVKSLSQGKVFTKTQYDGAGRVKNKAVSYQAGETLYTDADDLAGDTVIQETRYVMDANGAAELVQLFERKHDGTGVGPLDGSSGNARAQYLATWYDKLHRTTYQVNYGTNGGLDLTARPAGNPPTASATDKLVTLRRYFVEGETYDRDSSTLTFATNETVDPQGLIGIVQMDDAGHSIKQIENWVNWVPGTDDDRTREWTYDPAGRLSKITAKASVMDQVTEYQYGVSRGVDNSDVSSGDLVYKIKYPDPDAGAGQGQPSNDANDQEVFGYSALGELIWKRDQQLTEHFYTYDERGRVTDDTVTVLGSGLNGDVRRIGRTYDALDRPLVITSYDATNVVLNQAKIDYGPFNTVVNFWQEWDGSLTGSSRKVSYAYQYPVDGTTGLRRTSTTYPVISAVNPTAKVIDEVYSGTTNDTLSRVSGRADPVDGTLFTDSYLGLGRLVERDYGDPYLRWTLVGTDTDNSDNYLGLDRFGRIDELRLKNNVTSALLNNYLYSYNYNSQVTVRRDVIGNVSGSYEFDETWAYDNLNRLVRHKRGVYNPATQAMTTTRLDELWGLDRSGNTTSFTVSSGGSAPPIPAAYNASNEMTERNGDTSYATYSSAGNLTTEGGSTGYGQTYDAWNRLVNVTSNGATILTYKYNGLGRICERSVGGTPARYYYGAEDQLLEEKRISDGTTLNWYLWGTQYIDDLVVFSPSLSTYEFIVQDPNYNVLTKFDIGGSILRRFVYERYGLPGQLSANWSTWLPINVDIPGFTGRTFQSAHARNEHRNRVLDTDMMAWMQRDPIGIWGDSNLVGRGNWGNGYGYVGNAITTFMDPSGLLVAVPPPVVVPGPIIGPGVQGLGIAGVRMANAPIGACIWVGANGYWVGNCIADCVPDSLIAWAVRRFIVAEEVVAIPQPRPQPVPPPLPPSPPRPPPPVSFRCSYEILEYSLSDPDDPPDWLSYENYACPPANTNVRVCLQPGVPDTCHKFDGFTDLDGDGNPGPGDLLLECKRWSGPPSDDTAYWAWRHFNARTGILHEIAISYTCGNPFELRHSNADAAATSPFPGTVHYPGP